MSIRNYNKKFKHTERVATPGLIPSNLLNLNFTLEA